MFLFLFVYILGVVALCHGDHAVPSPSHDCYRPCSWPPESMICDYHFRVEWFSSMSPTFCGDCPGNTTDCDAENCIALNGVQRPIITVNRQLPGPSIQVCEGDVIKVKVENRLDDHGELAIHWHGIHQVGTPYMDGVPKVTQCPIPHGSSFVYTFNASNSGTHYWHAHSGMQRADGCAGTMIVRQARERDVHYDNYDIDDEAHVLLLQDWFDSTTLTRFIGHHLGGLPNNPDAILINGHGQRQTTGHAGHGGTVAYTPREVFRVEPGQRHRFRLISNAIVNCPLQVSVDSHTLEVISSDGFDVERAEVDAVVLFAGERYDVILNADQEAGNYWLRVQGLGDCSTSQEVALINYAGTHKHMSPSLPANSTVTVGVVLNPYNELDLSSPLSMPVYSLRSLVEEEGMLYTTDDVTRYYLPLDFNSVTRYATQGHMTSGDMHMDENSHTHTKRAHGTDDHDGHGGHMGGNGTGMDTGMGGHMHGGTTSQINHASFLVPAENLLTSYNNIDKSTLCDVVDISHDCKTKYCECTQVLTAALGETIELVLVDEGFGSDQSHPMHIHGHAFRVIAQARMGDTVTAKHVEEMDKAGNIVRILENPPLKDTVAVPDGGYTIVRFRATNPGWWLFHCHIQFHTSNGMMLVIRVGEEADLPPPPIGTPTCSSLREDESMDTGGGHVTTSKMGVLFTSLMMLLFALVA